MTALWDISLLRPLWLLAFPAIALLAILIRQRQSQIGSWDAVIDPNLMDAMRQLGRVETAKGGALSHQPLWIAGLIALALTGPAFEKRDAQSFRNLDGAVFIVDVSTSVAENDLWPQLVTMGRVGISALGSKPAALIVYAGDAYVASALTADTHQIGLTLSLLDEKTVPDQGSRPELALALARNILEQAEIIAGDVVLLTDGAGLGPDAITQAQEISASGARLSVVQLPSSDPENKTAIQTTVRIGSGDVYTLTDGNDLAKALGSNATARMEKQDYLLLFWSDYGRYFLLLALIPALALFRRRAS